MKVSTKGIMYFIGFIALTQLAFSQIHISTITTVFTSSIGLYLFIYIILGLIATFNASKLEKGEYLSEILILVLTIVFGVIYLYMLIADVNTVPAVTMEKVMGGLVLGIIGVAMYAIGLIATVLNLGKNKRKLIAE